VLTYVFNVLLVKNIWTKKIHQNQRHYNLNIKTNKYCTAQDFLSFSFYCYFSNYQKN